MSLRLISDSESSRPAQPASDAIPFGDARPRAAWQPRAAWNPASNTFDSIAHAESALDHVEKQMTNLRALLGMDQPTTDDRAA
jgi:hypothetical protein